MRTQQVNITLGFKVKTLRCVVVSHQTDMDTTLTPYCVVKLFISL